MRTVFVVLLLLARSPATGAELPLPDAFTPVVARFVGAPTTPVQGSDGRWHLVYELWVTNTRPVPATITRIEALDYDHQDRVLGRLEGDALAAATLEINAHPAPDTTLAASTSKLVLVELAFAQRDAVPARIVHRLSGTGAGGPAGTTPVAISYLLAPWQLAARPLPVLGAPVRGTGWLAINGCCSTRGAHRGAVLPVDGTLYDAQRFAIDWVRIGADGRMFSGDPSKVESYLAYDAPLLAVADATVVDVLDSLDDQVPPTLPDPQTITIDNVDGNHVILDLGNGVYALYAHVKKGSITVKPGERVRRGQELARLGNTGNSSAPHLHLHLMDAPSALGADGVPYVFERFTLTGTIDAARWYAPDTPLDATYAVLPPGGGAGPRRDELPLDLAIVDFE